MTFTGFEPGTSSKRARQFPGSPNWKTKATDEHLVKRYRLQTNSLSFDYYCAGPGRVSLLWDRQRVCFSPLELFSGIYPIQWNGITLKSYDIRRAQGLFQVCLLCYSFSFSIWRPLCGAPPKGILAVRTIQNLKIVTVGKNSEKVPCAPLE